MYCFFFFFFGYIKQWLGSYAEVFYMPPVVATKTKKLLNFSNIAGYRPLKDFAFQQLTLLWLKF